MNIIPHVSILNLPLANVEPNNLSYGRSIINELDIIIPAAIATNNMNQNCILVQFRVLYFKNRYSVLMKELKAIGGIYYQKNHTDDY